MNAPIPFSNTYARLPDRLFARLAPAPVREPGLIAVNRPLALELGIDPDWLAGAEGVEVLAGNRVPDGSEPIAQAYAGHQFGGWVPQLGDGRAILLGEVVAADGTRRDIQLKGSGRTPFSRGGDGRAWLGPVIREYVVSEAMHALGIPTTRALAAVTTGETVWRETALPGAILARVAASHVRVGTFQYFAARDDTEALRALFDFARQRHDPSASDPLQFLAGVVERQASLVAAWMGVGFIHGVMNTDNTTISGETIDYGPCAFLDGYDPAKVFSSIDTFGRYAYGRQPDVAYWNLAQLASALLPLIGPEDVAVPAATEVLGTFPDAFRRAWLQTFAAKLGISDPRPEDAELIEEFLSALAATEADFTNAFRGLVEGDVPPGLDDWARRWRDRIGDEEVATGIMAAANPAIIPRNHRIEAAITAAVNGDLDPFRRLNDALARPYDARPEYADLRQPPRPEEIVRQTFCGT